MEPDYSQYTEDALRQARRTVDAQRFPERARDLDDRIAAIESAAQDDARPAGSGSGSSAPDPAKRVMHQVAALLAIVAIADIVGTNVRAAPGTINIPGGTLLGAALLGFGGVRGAGIVRWMVCLGAAGFVLNALLPLAVFPPDLIWTFLRLAPLQLLPDGFMNLGWLVLYGFVFYRLGHPAITDARMAAGLKKRRLWIPGAIGCAAAIVGGAFLWSLLHGARSDKAVAMVAARLGPHLRHTTAEMQVMTNGDKTRVQARVISWDHDSIAITPVMWEE